MKDLEDLDFSHKLYREIMEWNREERERQLKNLPDWLAGKTPFYFREGMHAETDQLLFGSRIIITDGTESVEEFWDFPNWCADKALEKWKAAGYMGEPEGWTRATTRGLDGKLIWYRRRLNGDKTTEFIAP